MKNTLFSFLLCFYTTSHALPLQGNYTIDSNTASAGNNFQTWTDFKDTIIANGVSGPVRIDVMTDIDLGEEESLRFTYINGASFVNRIMVNGHGKCLSMDVADAVIVLHDASWFTFDSLVIRNNSANPDAIGFRLSFGSSHNIISNCIIEFSNYTVRNKLHGAYVAVADSTGVLIKPSLENCNFNIISNNLMRTTNPKSPGPSFGILVNGGKNRYGYEAQNTVITGNKIQNFSYTGIYMSYTNGNEVIHNDISRTNANADNCEPGLIGINVTHSFATERATRIDSNFLHHLPYDSITIDKVSIQVSGIVTSSNKGSAEKPISISHNGFFKLYSAGHLYLTDNTDNVYMDLIANEANDCDVPVSSSSEVVFHGFESAGISGSYRINKNVIRGCDGGDSWTGISSIDAGVIAGASEINDNRIINNQHSSSYKYNIWSTNQSIYSNSSHRIHIKRNLIRGNGSDFNNHYGIYCRQGFYEINDNIIDSNSTQFEDKYGISMYGIFTYGYGFYNIRSNRIIANKCISEVAANFCGIAVYQAFQAHVLSNLLAGNIGYDITGGINITSKGSSAIIQNTIVIDGNLTTSTMHSATPFGITTDSSLDVRGNIVDVKNSRELRCELTAKEYLYCDYNTFYAFKNILMQSWATIERIYKSDTAFVNFTKGSQNLIPLYGNYFDFRWASKLKWNQDDVPTSEYNNTDVYGMPRNPSFSDRGAVEYNGPTSLTTSEMFAVSYIYPNPVSGEEINVMNSNYSKHYKLLNVAGLELMCGALQEGINSIKIPLSPGLYLLILDGEELPLKFLVVD